MTAQPAEPLDVSDRKRLVRAGYFPWGGDAWIHESDEGTVMSRADALARLAVAQPAEPPSHTRLILASEDLLETWGARTEDGYRISAEWGEMKPEGWYEPTFHIDYTDRLAAGASEADDG